MAETPKSQDDLSIEEILGSIRRIIAEDDEQPADAAAAGTAASLVEEEEEEPLELTNKIDSDGTILQPQSAEMSAQDIVFEDAPVETINESQDDMIVMEQVAPEPQPVTPDVSPTERTRPQEETVAMTQREENPAPSEPLLSSTTAIATAAVMAKLARQAAINEEGNNGLTLEAMVREMLKPMLREWLDSNLPELVQKMVERELERLTKRL